MKGIEYVDYVPKSDILCFYLIVVILSLVLSLIILPNKHYVSYNKCYIKYHLKNIMKNFLVRLRDFIPVLSIITFAFFVVLFISHNRIELYYSKEETPQNVIKLSKTELRDLMIKRQTTSDYELKQHYSKYVKLDKEVIEYLDKELKDFRKNNKLKVMVIEQ